MIAIIDGRNKEVKSILKELNRPAGLDYPEERKIVKKIIDDINNKGETALLGYAEELDGYAFGNLEEIEVSTKEIEHAYSQIAGDYIELMEKARERIWNYHSKQLQKSWFYFEEDMDAFLGQKVTPLERVGIYVPGGRAAYPSSVLMNAVPAIVAGVPEIIMVTPPSKEGKVNPHTLVAADIAGVNRIFKIGGAQSIAALAFGVGPISKVDKITGPGNIYVTLAKKEVYGEVDIDMIAGPSEIVVVADNTGDPTFIAADLLSQAEHDPMATSILITDDFKIGNATKEEINRQMISLPKSDIASSSIRDYGAIIVVDNIEKGIDLANAIAPEHLELAIDRPFEMLGRIKHAGSIFLGHYSPEPLGDYMAGPNHILPTNGSARFFSALSVDDFIKKSCLISFSKEALEDLHGDIAALARSEGLEAHARSVEVRFDKG